MNMTNIQIAPNIRDLRRPKFSTTYKPPKVVAKFTAPRMHWVTKLSERPAPAKIVVPYIPVSTKKNEEEEEQEEDLHSRRSSWHR